MYVYAEKKSGEWAIMRKLQQGKHSCRHAPNMPFKHIPAIQHEINMRNDTKLLYNGRIQ